MSRHEITRPTELKSLYISISIVLMHSRSPVFVPYHLPEPRLRLRHGFGLVTDSPCRILKYTCHCPNLSSVQVLFHRPLGQRFRPVEPGEPPLQSDWRWHLPKQQMSQELRANWSAAELTPRRYRCGQWAALQPKMAFSAQPVFARSGCASPLALTRGFPICCQSF
jgi:hypothetical protein